MPNHGYGGLGIDDATFNEQADTLLALAMRFPAGTGIERDEADFEQRRTST